MKVYRSIEDVPEIKNPILTLGTFDGVHLGHQKIIALLRENAKKMDGETVLFTFHPHPRIVLHPDDHGMELIQSIDERIKKLEKCGIDHLILFPFSIDFSRTTATEFVRDILINKINVRLMTIGYNHHFGRNREGNLELLKELGDIYDFEVQELPAFKEGEISISSTKIRNAITEGNIKLANTYLGNVFEFKGKVKRGDQIGSQIGFPTANIEPLGENQIIPQNGVYAVGVVFEGTMYGGMMNIGTRPTVSQSGEKRIEIHLFDFDRTIYERELQVIVYERVRSEKTFDSLTELKEQLKNDQTNCLRILDNLSVSE